MVDGRFTIEQFVDFLRKISALVLDYASCVYPLYLLYSKLYPRSKLVKIKSDPQLALKTTDHQIDTINLMSSLPQNSVYYTEILIVIINLGSYIVASQLAGINVSLT